MLVNVLLFSVFSLFLALMVPTSDESVRNHFSRGTWATPSANIVPHAASIAPFLVICALSAILCIFTAPYLIRLYDKMQHAMTRRGNELASLHAIDTLISAELNLDVILQVAVREATVSVDAEFGILRLFEHDVDQSPRQAWFNVHIQTQDAIRQEESSGAGALTVDVTATQRELALDDHWSKNRIAFLLQMRNKITVPISHKNETIGVLVIGNRTNALNPLSGFTEDDQVLLESVASTIAIAVQNSRLFEETERRGEVLRSLVARTGDAIAASSDAPRLMQILADEAARILGTRRVAVYGFDERSREFIPIAFHEEAAPPCATVRKNPPVLVNHSVNFFDQVLSVETMLPPSQVAIDTTALENYVPSVHDALGLPEQVADFLQDPGYLFVLRARDESSIGLLCMVDSNARPRNADTTAFARALASQAAVALQNAMLSQQTQELLTQTQALQAATNQIAAELDADRALEEISESTRQVLHADGYALWDWDRSTEAWSRLAAFGDSPVTEENGPTEEELEVLSRILERRTAQTFSSEDVEDASDNLACSSMLSMPLIHAGEFTGAMTLYYSEIRTFTNEKKGLAQSLANQTANALHNARLFSELSIALARQRRIAETFQRMLLPVVASRIGVLEIAQFYQAGSDEAMIGGDFYDLFVVGPDVMGIVMADVTGKGLTAAVQTAMIKYTLRGFAIESPFDPAEVLLRVNRVLCNKTSHLTGFVTLFYGLLNTATGECAYAVAGHEPPLVRRHKTGTVESLEAEGGLPLGCFMDGEYATSHTCLQPGDEMLLFTDGLSEARPEGGAFLGVEGLAQVLKTASGTPNEAVSQIFNEVRAYANDELKDDVAMLYVRHWGGAT